MEGRTTIAIAPPPVDHPASRPDSRVRRRADRRTRDAPELIAHGGLYARLYREQFLGDAPTPSPSRWNRDDHHPDGSPRARRGARLPVGHRDGPPDRLRGGRARLPEPGRNRPRGARGVHRDGRDLDRGQEAPGGRWLPGPRARQPAARNTRKVFTDIEVVHEVTGMGISRRPIRRSIELSATKYCPVNAMLSAGATVVHHRYRIHSTGAAPYEAEGEVIATGALRPTGDPGRPDLRPGRPRRVSGSGSAPGSRGTGDSREAPRGPDPGHEVGHPPAQEVERQPRQ
jgi:hypothetical protein